MVGIAAGCGGGSPDPPGAGEAPARPDDARESLLAATGEILSFLIGQATTIDTMRFADTVRLIVPPEGGGAAAEVERAALLWRSSWTIPSVHRRIGFSLVPPPEYSVSTLRAGTHFRCLESDLADVYPPLAHLPHVGVRLQPPGAGSCLQSWNATFLFDTSSGAPELTAVLYDQWEW